MSTFHHTWFVCGGWAVDSWLGRQTRDHGDFDITVSHDDHRALFDHLEGWHLVAHTAFEPGASTTDRWDGRPLRPTDHIHARPPGDANGNALDRWIISPGSRPADGLDLEILLNERRSGGWVLSPEPLVAVPLDSAARESPAGLPTVVPAILMFYKATAYQGQPGYPRAYDKADFLALRPYLSPADRSWLEGAIVCLQAHHPWLDELRE
jgi:hypothetical protein